MTWLNAIEVKETYGFDAPCAILSTKAARVDPYQLAYGLLGRIERNGARIHDRSPVARILANARGVEVHTTHGAVVKAKYLVMAAGYESQRFLDQRVAQNRSSYAFVTDPIDAQTLGALTGTMMWESARPYLYLRTTSDNRLLIGGDDDSIDIPAKRDALVDRKARKLAAKVSKLFERASDRGGVTWRHVCGNEGWIAVVWRPSTAWPARVVRDGVRGQRHHLFHAGCRLAARDHRAQESPAVQPVWLRKTGQTLNHPLSKR